MRSSLTDGASHGLALVAAKVVHDDHVAGFEGGHEALFDPGGEGDAIDRPVEDVGGVDPVAPQGGKEGHGSPVAEGCIAAHAMTFATPAMRAHHIGLHPGLVDEDQPFSCDPALVAAPAGAPARDVAPRLLGGQQSFF